jgi:hypothetical protein
MEKNLIQVKSFGWARPETLYSEDVSLSFDTTQHSKSSKIKVLVQVEPSEIIDIKNIIINEQNNFDLILAWDENILNSCSNAKKFIFGSCWIDFKTFKENKKNEISFISSNKRQTTGHQFRHQILSKYSNIENINGFSFKKIYTPPRIENKNILFENAKFHVVVENTSKTNWITEKIIDCFATKTIPIYYGCPNIGEFFNEKGVLKFNTLEELDNILNTITPEIYDNLEEVINENYEKSKEYFDFHERLKREIENYIDCL